MALLVIISFALLGVDGLVGGLAVTLATILSLGVSRRGSQSKDREKDGQNVHGIHFGNLGLSSKKSLLETRAGSAFPQKCLS